MARKTYSKSLFEETESCTQHLLISMAKAVQPHFVLPRACITAQGMAIEIHNVYYLREVRGLTNKAVGELLDRSSHGGLTTLRRAATAVLEAQEVVFGAWAYLTQSSPQVYAME